MRKRRLPIFRLLVIFFVSLAGIYLFFLWNSSSLGKFDRFNVVLAGSSVSFISYDRQNKSLTAVLFPNDFYVTEVLPGYGSYKIPAVYSLGELDKRGGPVLSWTIAELLGVPVDGYIYREGKAIDREIKKSFRDPGIFWETKTDLSLVDLLRLASNVQLIRFDRIKVIDLASFSEPLVLADGTMAKSLDKEGLDRVLSGQFFEDAIVQERLRVEVVNSLPVVGLGSRAARVLSNLGMTVVNVETSDEQFSTCQISADKKHSQSQTVRRAAKIYSCSVRVKETTGRAEVTVGLGRDYARRFSK